MKRISLLIAMMFAYANVIGQDKDIATKLTFDQAQEGFPTWSPDGKFVVYSLIDREDTLGRTGLWKMSPVEKVPIQLFSGIAEHPKWSPDGHFIVFDADSGNSIKMIPAMGGIPVSIIPDSFQIQFGGMPCWSPDGKQIAFLEYGKSSICIVDRKSGEVSRIFQSEDLVPILGCWSSDGKNILITLLDPQTRKSTIWNISSDGEKKEQIIGHHEGVYRYLALSPDGCLLVYAAIEEKDLGLWIMPAEGGKSIHLVSDPGYNENPNWSPNGKRIAFTSTKSGNFDIWILNIDIEQITKASLSFNCQSVQEYLNLNMGRTITSKCF